MKYVLAAFLTIIATGYVVYYGFWMMNLKSDVTYFIGSLGIVIWFGFVYFCWVRAFRNLKEKKDAASKSIDSSSSDRVAGGGVYN